MTDTSATGIHVPRLYDDQVSAALAYSSDRLGTLLQCARTGPVVELFENHFVVTGPEPAMEVLRRTGSHFRIPVTATGKKFSGVRGNPDFDAWLGTRNQISGLFRDEDFLAQISDHIEGEALDLADRWARDGSVSEPVPDLMMLAGRAAVRAFLGPNVPEAAVARLAQQVVDCSAAEQVNRSSAVAYRYWVRPLIPRYRRQDRGFKALRSQIVGLLPHASERSLAGILAAAGKTPEQVTHAGVTVLRAGSEGTAGAFNWGLHTLAAGLVTPDELADDTRRPLALREVMRLYPPVWLIRRQATCDTTLLDTAVPAGAEITLSPYATQRTAADYPEPDAFRPERWEGLRTHPGAYLPYGAGVHWCVGTPLAELERDVVLRSLSRAYVFTREGPMDPVPLGTLRPRAEALGVTRR